MGFDGTANFAYRPLAFYTRRTHCFRIFFLSTRYIGRYILAYLYRDILTRLQTIQQYEFGVYIVHVYRNVQFIFFPRKDDSKKTTSHAHKSKVTTTVFCRWNGARTGNVFGCERHALFARRNGPTAVARRYALSRWKIKKINKIIIIIKKRVYVRSVFMITFLCFWSSAIGFQPSYCCCCCSCGGGGRWRPPRHCNAKRYIVFKKKKNASDKSYTLYYIISMSRSF